MPQHMPQVDHTKSHTGTAGGHKRTPRRRTCESCRGESGHVGADIQHVLVGPGENDASPLAHLYASSTPADEAGWLAGWLAD